MANLIPQSKRGFSPSAQEPPDFPGHEIIRRLGFGAASVIYAVKNKSNNEIHALKYVVRQEGQDGRMIEQVETEFRVGSRINHPYIRNYYDIYRRRRRLRTREVLMLMEYCPGVSLEQSPSRSLLDLLLIFRMVADGLHGMHAQGFLHCDMKPNNIIIADNGAIRIIDLGQSCANGTVKPRIQGTPDYIAPEQVKRRPLNARTDVFNLGATMYWALTGKHVPTLIPRQSDRLDLALASRENTLSPHQLKPRIPVGVSNLVMECVRSDPRQRPADMPTLISRLDLLIHMIAGSKLGANGLNGNGKKSRASDTNAAADQPSGPADDDPNEQSSQQENHSIGI
ncbi:MAG: serine/threonine protein kinase [Sedimentisphaerales bacterium]|nr:serine/threonine protein kinase [Sedimentisphaerales bacterium]